MKYTQPTPERKPGFWAICMLGAFASSWFGVPALAGEGQDWQANGQGGGAPDRLKPGHRTGNSRMRPCMFVEDLPATFSVRSGVGEGSLRLTHGRH
ncbi:MAG: hypothetical protein NT167_12175 [Verrucomicrobia bacterium]|nr:hypothetical protein [Verrucomicrobiota bacterium]